jgi:hypothetical protein
MPGAGGQSPRSPARTPKPDEQQAAGDRLGPSCFFPSLVQIVDLARVPPPLDLSQLDLALNPSFGDGVLGGGDFAVRLNAAATSSGDGGGLLSLAGDETRLGEAELQLWRRPEFQKRFTESFLAETDIEPTVTQPPPANRPLRLPEPASRIWRSSI